MIDERRTFDGVSTGLMLSAAALMAVGVVILASAGAGLDKPFFESITLKTAFVRQVMFAVGSVCVMLLCARVGPSFGRWRGGSLWQPSILILLIAIGLLALVWVPGIGVESHGRRRWAALGPIGFQPSEIAKPALVIFLAAILSRSSKRTPGEKPDLTIPMLAIGVVCAMVGKEDFGTAILLAVVGGLMILVRGCAIATLMAWSVPVVTAFMTLLLLHPYRVKRLLSFLTIWDDPRGEGYHPIQSLAAISSGGWTGAGLGAGMAKYGYLPESRTDFVFSIICEETGVLGGAAVVLLFVVLVFLGWVTIRRAPSRDGGFAKLFAFGVTAAIASQALMNIAVVTVVAPTKGIALPLVSSGGSGLLCIGAAIGLLAGTPRRSAAAGAWAEAPGGGIALGVCA